MEPELVVVLLVLATGCSAWFARPPLPMPARGAARAMEVHAWRALVRPLVPLTCVLAWMIGWALVEQEPADEIPPATAIALASVYGLVVLRALLRLLRSASRRAHIRTVGVTGLLSPRVQIEPAFASALDSDERAAVLAHEHAHVAGRDPLRILLAQLAADLQWPSPTAPSRFAHWRHTLELLRDDEARRAGAHGPSLASAILIATRAGDEDVPVAGVAAGNLGARIERLLAPLPEADGSSPRHWLVLGAPALTVIGACVGGRT